MKWLVIIWTLYLLALSVVPCSDSLNSCKGTESAPMSTQTHDHNQDSDDHCTPFCHCSCCSISIALSDIKVIPKIEKPLSAFITEKVSLQDISVASSYHGSIWQPPRVNA